MKISEEPWNPRAFFVVPSRLYILSQAVRMGSSYVPGLPMEVQSPEPIDREDAVISRNESAGCRGSSSLVRWMSGILLSGAIAWGCGGSATGLVLFVDAEFDPATVSDTTIGISEANPGVAQIFTVLADGKFERFSRRWDRGSGCGCGLCGQHRRLFLPHL